MTRPVPLRPVKNELTLILVTAGVLVLGGCVITTAPGQAPHAEWAGTYAREQAARDESDRAAALGVRAAFARDPVLKNLHINIFAHDGEVTLCGKFPDTATRSRALAVAASVKGVTGADTECGGH